MPLFLLLVVAALTCDGGLVWRRHHDRRMVARSSLRSLPASRVFQHRHHLRTRKHGRGREQRRRDRYRDCRGCGVKRSRQLEIAIPALSGDPISIPVAIPAPAEYPQQTQHFFQTGDMKSIKHHRIRESNNGSFPQYYPRVTSWNRRRISMVSAPVMSASLLTILSPQNIVHKILGPPPPAPPPAGEAARAGCGVGVEGAGARMLGGHTTDPGTHPWVVSLVFR